jgi:hypothetical protein
MFKKAKLTPAARKARNGRIAALSVFLGGAAASLAANLMASNGTPVGMVVGAFPALMLLGSLYLLENGSTYPAWVRWAIVPVILVAAWMSYWHIVEVVMTTGEGAVTAHLYAIIIDLPMAIASCALRPAPARPARRRPAAKKNVTPITKARRAS